MSVVHFEQLLVWGQSPSQAMEQNCSSFILFASAYIIQVLVSHAADTTHRTQTLQAEIYDKTNILRSLDTFQACQQSLSKM